MGFDDFAGRTAVITGAGSGIGRAMAHHAVSEGMRVVAADMELTALDETVDALRDAGGEAIAVPTDVTDPDAVEALAVTAFEAFGAVHVLHNNAGVLQAGNTWQRTVPDWQWVMNVNFWGVLHGIRAFVPRLLAQEQAGDGAIHIVNTASLAGLATMPSMAPYVVSKFACSSLTECLMHDLRGQGSAIGVSCLVPGLVDTRIGTSTRNRPDEPPGHSQAPDHWDVAEGLDAAAPVAGLPPSEAARMVFDAIRTDEFWIGTGELYDEMLVPRFAAILEHRFPGDQ